MNDEERQNKLRQIRTLLDKAGQEYVAVLTEERAAQHRRDLAYRQVEAFIREEQNLLLRRDL
jgi:hypothetical protein